MKIVIFSRSRVNHVADDIRSIFSFIERYGFDYAINSEFAQAVQQLTEIVVPKAKQYDNEVDISELSIDEAVMVCYGGDGTMLEGAHRLQGAQIPVVGINLGRIGFLTSFAVDGIEELFRQISLRELRYERRSMIRVECEGVDLGDQMLALNEFSVQRYDESVISVETFVDGQMVATYHGDGVILSTPTGSTAYSLSAGGPVVAPQCSCFVLSPLASHNLTMRPVVVPDQSEIEMRVESRSQEVSISLDNRTYRVPSGSRIVLKRADEELFLALPRNISFYDTLRYKMMWGVDLRG